MEKKFDSPSGEPSLSALESGLFGTMLQFHQRFVGLVRSSSLDEASQIAASKRIAGLLDEMMAEMKTGELSLKDFDLEARLESVYRKAKEIVDELGISGDKRGEKGGSEDV